MDFSKIRICIDIASFCISCFIRRTVKLPPLFSQSSQLIGKIFLTFIHLKYNLIRINSGFSCNHIFNRIQLLQISYWHIIPSFRILFDVAVRRHSAVLILPFRYSRLQKWSEVYLNCFQVPVLFQFGNFCFTNPGKALLIGTKNRYPRLPDPHLQQSIRNFFLQRFPDFLIFTDRCLKRDSAFRIKLSINLVLQQSSQIINLPANVILYFIFFLFAFIIIKSNSRKFFFQLCFIFFCRRIHKRPGSLPCICLYICHLPVQGVHPQPCANFFQSVCPGIERPLHRKMFTNVCHKFKKLLSSPGYFYQDSSIHFFPVDSTFLLFFKYDLVPLCLLVAYQSSFVSGSLHSITKCQIAGRFVHKIFCILRNHKMQVHDIRYLVQITIFQQSPF